jgi:hypothetical protein
VKLSQDCKLPWYVYYIQGMRAKQNRSAVRNSAHGRDRDLRMQITHIASAVSNSNRPTRVTRLVLGQRFTPVAVNYHKLTQ